MKWNLTLATACVFVGLVGCGDPEPQSYTTPKEESDGAPSAAPASANGSGMQVLPGMAESVAQFGQPTWSAPADWEEGPASGIRRGFFHIHDENGHAELTVTVFPGDVGGTLANINRWRQQVGLGPVESVESARVTVDGAPTEVVFLEGPGGQSILGAMVDRGTHTWFFKMMGDATAVEAQQGAFADFLTTVAFSE